MASLSPAPQPLLQLLQHLLQGFFTDLRFQLRQGDQVRSDPQIPGHHYERLAGDHLRGGPPGSPPPCQTGHSVIQPAAQTLVGEIFQLPAGFLELVLQGAAFAQAHPA